MLEELILVVTFSSLGITMNPLGPLALGACLKKVKTEGINDR